LLLSKKTNSKNRFIIKKPLMSHSFVIDTNFFINRQRPINLGDNKEEVVAGFAKLVSGLVKNQTISLFTTPASFQEISSFFADQPQTLKTLAKILTIASYSRNDLKINAALFEKLIAETGRRLYRGLRVVEEPLKNIIIQTKPPSAEEVGKAVAQFRDKYRRATREGFIDSTTDLGLIFLAKEIGASIVSSDKGLLDWARVFGCCEVLPEVFVEKIKDLVKPSRS
jgi:RNA ligase partner protein